MILVLLLLPLVFYVSNSKARDEHTVIDRVVLTLSAPVQWLVVSTLDGVNTLWSRYINLIGVAAENVELRGENSRLIGELAARQEMMHDNEKLRLLVGLRERVPNLGLLFAEVVSVSPSPLYRSLRIDRGQSDGVEVGAAVINDEGVVGKVAQVSKHYSDVMLLIDGNNSLDVLVQRTRARARVRGQGGDDAMGLDMQYLGRTADIEPGDVLITSGLGNTFPKGLRVAKVVSLERRAFGLYQRAVAEPTVDFRRLEAVMVVHKGYAADVGFETPERPADDAVKIPDSGTPWREAPRTPAPTVASTAAAPLANPTPAPTALGPQPTPLFAPRQ